MACRFCELLESGDWPVFYEDGTTIAALSSSQTTFCKSYVVYKAHAESPLSLSEGELSGFLQSVRKVAFLLQEKLEPALLNYAILRNYVPHLHCHVVPRFRDVEKDAYFIDGKIEPIEWGRWTEGRFRVGRDELERRAELLREG